MARPAALAASSKKRAVGSLDPRAQSDMPAGKRPATAPRGARADIDLDVIGQAKIGRERQVEAGKGGKGTIITDGVRRVRAHTPSGPREHGHMADGGGAACDLERHRRWSATCGSNGGIVRTAAARATRSGHGCSDHLPSTTWPTEASWNFAVPPKDLVKKARRSRCRLMRPENCSHRIDRVRNMAGREPAS